MEAVHWVSLDALAQQPHLDAEGSGVGFALYFVGMPLQALRQTRAVQVILEEGREEGRQEGREAGRQQEAAAVAIRQLVRRFCSLEPANKERRSALSLPRLEQLPEVLLDFTGPGDLQAWLAANAGD